MLTLLPWHAEPWRRLVGAVERRRLAHGLLIVGPEGTGRREFAQCFASRLLCEAPPPEAIACGRCRSCVLFEAGNHPDLKRVVPDDGKDQISVDAVRDLIDYMHLSSQSGRVKIAMIDPADAMNRHAANTLLKTLEEPPAGAVLILITHRPSVLPATVRSRCQAVHVSGSLGPDAERWLAERLPPGGDAAQWLSLARGAPLAALEMANSGGVERQTALLHDLRELRARVLDPAAVAKRWSAAGVDTALRWMLGFIGDMARRKLRARAAGAHVADFDGILQTLSDELDLAELMSCYDLVLRNYRGATGLIALNGQALLEEVVIQWQQAGRRTRG